MKVSFYGLQMWEREYLEAKLKNIKGLEAFFTEADLKPGEMPEGADSEIVSVFADSEITKSVLDNFPNLKFIATRSTGFDHIDTEVAKERRIAVSNVPSYGSNTVAEFTFAILLALSRKIYEAYDQVRESGSFSQERLQGFDLEGKTLGVVGTGRIGCHVVRIAKGFGMKIIAYDLMPNEKLAEEYKFEYKSLDEVLAGADVLTIHVPHTDETHHLINKKAISKMKDGAYLVNTSRGAIVETYALVEALKSGKIAGAALDVLEEEGAIKDELDLLRSSHPNEEELRATLANHILIDMPNVIITPHNAFNTKEALQRILDVTIENIKSFLSGELQNTI